MNVNYQACSQSCDKRLLASPSVCPPGLPHRTTRLPEEGFSWDIMIGTVRKSDKNIQVWAKRDWNTRHFTWKPKHLIIISLRSLPEMKVSDKSFSENQNLLFMYFFRQSYCLGESYEKYSTSRQNIDHRTQYNVRKIRFTCRVTKNKIQSCVVLETYCFRPNETLR